MARRRAKPCTKGLRLRDPLLPVIIFTTNRRSIEKLRTAKDSRLAVVSSDNPDSQTDPRRGKKILALISDSHIAPAFTRLALF